jgi:parvulin-like peptidyl-prolyl isomerase
MGTIAAAILVLQVYLVLRPSGASTPAAPAAVRKSPVSLTEVAVKLQRDNLHAAAARAYDEHLATVEPGSEEWANLQFQIGKLLAKAGRYEEAVGHFFRAQPVIPKANEEALRREIVDCLGRLGKHAEQGYELKDRLGKRGDGKSGGDEAAGKVLAWIGTETITASDLDDEISREIEERAASIPGLPPERLAELKAQAQKGFASSQARLAKLQEMVAREVLWREGQEKNLDEDERVRRRVSDFRRGAVIEEMVLSVLRDRIKVSDLDLRNYHQANADRYRERASARVRIAVLPDEGKAKEFLAAAKTEDDFARLAKEGSAESATRGTGGLLDKPVVQGEPLPVLGSVPELNAAIFATEAGRPIAAPVKFASGFAVAYVAGRTPERTPPFEEVRERVAKDYLGEKEIEVQGAMVKELFQKHGVTINTQAFLPAGAAAPDAGGKPGEKKEEAPASPAAPPPAPGGTPGKDASPGAP